MDLRIFQSLSDAEAAVAGSSSSGDEDPIMASTDEGDGSQLLGFQLPLDTGGGEGFPVDGVLLGGEQAGTPGGADGSPAAGSPSDSISDSNGCGSSRLEEPSALAATGVYRSMPQRAAESEAAAIQEALEALARQLRATCKRFDPPAVLSALRSLDALAQPHAGAQRWNHANLAVKRDVHSIHHLWFSHTAPTVLLSGNK